MDAILKRQLEKLEYVSPPKFWADQQEELKRIPPSKLKHRDNKTFRENLQAAAFACGLNMIWAPKIIEFAPFKKDQEESDYDSAIKVRSKGKPDEHFTVQLKLVPQSDWLPTHKDEADSLNDLNIQLSKLPETYPTPQGTIFVIEVNRNITLTNESLSIPNFDAAGLFLLGSTSPERSTFVIIGDLLKPKHQRIGQFSLVRIGDKVMIAPVSA
ncbi:MAG: hypothetical protein ACPGES_10895 [Coraliomargarita sp.]